MGNQILEQLANREQKTGAVTKQLGYQWGVVKVMAAWVIKCKSSAVKQSRNTVWSVTKQLGYQWGVVRVRDVMGNKILELLANR